LTPEVGTRAASLVETDKNRSLGGPLDAEAPHSPGRHETWRVTTYRTDEEANGDADDVVTLHSRPGTHMDAPSHVRYDRKLYSGFDVAELSSETASCR